jgi:hypothetical protein
MVVGTVTAPVFSSLQHQRNRSPETDSQLNNRYVLNSILAIDMTVLIHQPLHGLYQTSAKEQSSSYTVSAPLELRQVNLLLIISTFITEDRIPNLHPFMHYHY